MAAELNEGRKLAGELREFAGEIESQKAVVISILEELPEDEFDSRPPDGGWSIGEHLDHLSKINRPYLAAIDRAVDEARARGLLGEGPFRHGRLGNWFVRSMEPPIKMRMKAPRSVQPGNVGSRDEVLQEFLAVQDEVLAALRGAAGVDLGRARLRSPFFSLLRLSVGQAFGAIAAHNRRHIWHMRRVAGP